MSPQVWQKAVFLLALAFFAIGVYFSFENIQVRLDGYVTTTGLVISLDPRVVAMPGAYLRTEQVPTISFQTNDGNAHTFEGDPDCCTVMQTVPVEYDSRNPNIAYMNVGNALSDSLWEIVLSVGIFIIYLKIKRRNQLLAAK